jgi:hypothetical protein
LCGFAPAHLGQGSMLRIALLPAPNVVNSRNVRRNTNLNDKKQMILEIFDKITRILWLPNKSNIKHLKKNIFEYNH